MIKSVAAVVLLLGTAAIAAAAPATSCYRPAEIEAEQAVRFQTELMVLSDTCRRDSYVRFEQRNAETLASYQQQLVDRFSRTQHGHGERAFDHYITALANEVSLNMGREPSAELCSRSAEFLTRAGSFDKGEFRRYVSDKAAEHKRDYRRCGE
jgi:hypothetical protein